MTPSNSFEADLRDTLEMLAGHERRAGGLLRKGCHYAGKHDFVLREGRWYPPAPLPRVYEQGRPRGCYGNAINLAVMHDLPYVEGYACSVIHPDMAVHHAWNLSPDGRVIDNTWGAYRRDDGSQVAVIGAAYLGVVFSVERADDATWHGDATILDDWMRDWPILREPWQGEPEGLAWHPSCRLEAVRAMKRGDWQAAYKLLEQADREARAS